MVTLSTMKLLQHNKFGLKASVAESAEAGFQVDENSHLNVNHTLFLYMYFTCDLFLSTL